jgi:hypothetical protein
MNFEFGTLSYDLPRESLITANTTAATAGRIYPVDTSGGAVTLTLATDIVSEGAYVIVNDEGGAAATNLVTVDTEGSAVIDGATSRTIDSDYGALSFYSDGTDWYSHGSTGGGGTL